MKYCGIERYRQGVGRCRDRVGNGEIETEKEKERVIFFWFSPNGPDRELMVFLYIKT